MSKYRITYRQGDEVKYISHLDFLRAINRVFVRADLPLKYSNGFNPHTVMTIGLPLSVGTTSSCDVLDIEFTQTLSEEHIKDSINKNCPMGIEVLSVKKADDLKPLFNISSAVYTAYFDSDKEINLEEYKNAPSVIIEKKSKRGMKEVNIKDFIRGFEKIAPSDSMYGVKMHIDAGNVSNLKPELVLSSIENFTGAKFKNIRINREKIFFDDGENVFQEEI